MPVRNKRNVFSVLFNILREYVGSQVDYDLHQALYTDTSDDEDNLIENSTVISYHFSSDSRIYLLLKYNDVRYYCFSEESVDISKISDEYFIEETDLKKGIWTLVQAKYITKCKPDISAIEVYNQILFLDEDENGTKAKEVAVDEILGYFNTLNIFKVVEDTVYDVDDIYNIKGYFDVTLNNNIINFSEEINVNFLSLFSSGLKSMPLDLVYLSFSSSQYKQVFIELYRCIEQLYPIPTLKDLLNGDSMMVKCPLEVAALFEDKINWRPRESEAIALIYKDLDATIIAKLDAIKIGTEYSSLTSSDFIYKLRNANVHFRKKLGKGELSNEKWADLIEVMLEIVLELYSKYDGEITS